MNKCVCGYIFFVYCSKSAHSKHTYYRTNNWIEKGFLMNELQNFDEINKLLASSHSRNNFHLSEHIHMQITGNTYVPNMLLFSEKAQNIHHFIAENIKANTHEMIFVDDSDTFEKLFLKKLIHMDYYVYQCTADTITDTLKYNLNTGDKIAIFIRLETDDDASKIFPILYENLMDDKRFVYHATENKRTRDPQIAEDYFQIYINHADKIARIPKLERYMATERSYNMGTTLCCESKERLQELYSDAFQTDISRYDVIEENTKVMITLHDNKTCDVEIKEIGKFTDTTL